MNGTTRHTLYLGMASTVFLVHLAVAACFKPSFALTMCGDIFPTLLLIIAILAVRENFRNSLGVLPAFWNLFASGLLVLLLSQLFWFYFDWRRLTAQPNPVIGDALFLISHVFFLCALAFRPHSALARRDLRIRGLDFAVLSLWFLCLYGYFAWPWQTVLRDMNRYNIAFYSLTLLQHLVIIAALAILALRKTGSWRRFYIQLMFTFVLVAGGNLVINVSIDEGTYYSGGFYDSVFFAALYLFTWIGRCGASLEPQEDAAPNRELVLSVWTARFAMLVMLSLPVIALWGLTAKDVPPSIALFRLRLIFGFMFVLGSFVYWKFTLLTRELVGLVRLTRTSIENLKAVENQVSHSEKFVALGRLAAGAAHEISNPLTAILGYSELLADIPSLSPDDGALAQEIREQVHRAQAAVASLRDSMRVSSPAPSLTVDKKLLS